MTRQRRSKRPTGARLLRSRRNARRSQKPQPSSSARNFTARSSTVNGFPRKRRPITSSGACPRHLRPTGADSVKHAIGADNHLQVARISPDAIALPGARLDRVLQRFVQASQCLLGRPQLALGLDAGSRPRRRDEHPTDAGRRRRISRRVMLSGMRRQACQSQAWCGQSHAGSRPGNRWRPSEQRACSGGGRRPSSGIWRSFSKVVNSQQGGKQNGEFCLQK